MKASVIKGLVVGSVMGVALGVGAYTFVYAKGASYLTNNPAACANCHVMQEQYDGWIKSSHGKVASCNDCHAPEGFLAKYYTKAENGFWHSLKFTTGNFHDPIQARPVNQRITEDACRKCHSDIVDAIDHPAHANEAFSCVRCHREVGHPK
jgi:cytochrome c nitrite reductase small subunit